MVLKLYLVLKLKECREILSVKRKRGGNLLSENETGVEICFWAYKGCGVWPQEPGNPAFLGNGCALKTRILATARKVMCAVPQSLLCIDPTQLGSQAGAGAQVQGS